MEYKPKLIFSKSYIIHHENFFNEELENVACGFLMWLELFLGGKNDCISVGLNRSIISENEKMMYMKTAEMFDEVTRKVLNDMDKSMNLFKILDNKYKNPYICSNVPFSLEIPLKGKITVFLNYETIFFKSIFSEYRTLKQMMLHSFGVFR